MSLVKHLIPTPPTASGTPPRRGLTKSFPWEGGILAKPNDGRGSLFKFQTYINFNKAINKRLRIEVMTHY